MPIYVVLCKGRRVLVQAPNEREAKLKTQKQLRAKSIHGMIAYLSDQPRHLGK